MAGFNCILYINYNMNELWNILMLIDKHCCSVKAYSSLRTPYSRNVISIGDSAAFVKVEVQRASMYGYHAANAIKDEFNKENGFEKYSDWWNKSFDKIQKIKDL